MHLVSVLSLLVTLTTVRSAVIGAGRAFPVDSENYAIKAFNKVNPGIEWDHTNFLIDLSGQYANCGAKKGSQKADKKTPNGRDIYYFIDFEPGDKSDTDAVNGYIKNVIDRWVSQGQYNRQWKDAKKFGCSVRPACTGNAVIACITTDDDFSNGGGNQGNTGGGNTGNTGGGNTGNTGGGNTGGSLTDDGEKDKPTGDSGLEGYQQKALAFTPQQYDIAESILGNKWDRSHFLEDLSGFETDCSMIGRNDWPFDKIKKAAREREVQISTQYGNAPNKGSTPDALKEILSRFKPITSARQMGCSIIPDCKGPSGMEVVISCLYEEV